MQENLVNLLNENIYLHQKYKELSNTQQFGSTIQMYLWIKAITAPTNRIRIIRIRPTSVSSYTANSTFILNYVDNLGIFDPTNSPFTKVKDKLSTRSKFKELGGACYILGLEITYSCLIGVLLTCSIYAGTPNLFARALPRPQYLTELLLKSLPRSTHFHHVPSRSSNCR